MLKPLKMLLLEVAVASSLPIFALDHAAKKELTFAFGEAIVAAASAYSAKRHYCEVSNAMGEPSSKPAPQIGG